MDRLILILIVFFTLLLTYQTFLAYFKRPIIEGNTTLTPNNKKSSDNTSSDNTSSNNTSSDNTSSNNTSSNNTSSTEQTAAAPDIVTLNTQVQTMQEQVNGLVQAQQQSGEDMVGTTATVVSGTG